MSHTYEQVLQYEVARELFNTRIAQCSARLDEEQAKAVPDAMVIGQVRADMATLVREREDLSLTADAAVAAAIRWHRVALARQQARYWGDGA